MAYKVQDLFDEILGIIGAKEISETPSMADYTTVKQTCNFMLDIWSAQNLMTRASIRESFPLVAGQGSYTIGIGGNFNTSKPSVVTDAFIRDSSGVDYPLEVINQDVYDAIDDKSFVQARPISVWYNPGATQQTTQTGTLLFYYIPDASTSYTVFIESQKYLTEFVNLSDLVTFEPAYYEAIAWNCAIRVWPKFYGKKQINSLILDMAVSSKRIIMTMNHRIPTMVSDVPSTKQVGGDNPLAGDWMT